MKKILFISSVLISSIVADNSLGTPIQSRTIDKVIDKQTITKEMIAQQTPTKTYTKSYTKTIIPTSSNSIITDTHTFKTDHHRYDKRFQDFDYDNNGYYNDDGYYYGYYDNTGYFYNNIFFTYNDIYTYDDRRYRRGYFIPRHHHYRNYRHHRINDWNRVHCYREPNHIVYGHYYEHRYYPSRYRHRDEAVMSLPRRNHTINQSSSRSSITNYNSRSYNDNLYNNRNYNNHRIHNSSRNYNDSRSYTNRASMQIHRDISSPKHTTRPPKRNTTSNQQHSSSHSSAHMQMPR